MRLFQIAIACLSLCSLLQAHEGHHEHEHDGNQTLLPVATALQNEVRITTDENYRYIESNGIPDHRPGQFPNRGNPNRIQSQQHKYRVPLAPQKAKQTTPLQRQPFGVALNGVPFDPGTAEFWRRDPRSGWNYDALSGKINRGLDKSNAHVQPDGSYHYHGIPTGLVDILNGKDETTSMRLLGYAADGFPIYGPMAYKDAENPRSELVKMTSSFQLKKGTRQGGPGGRYDGTFVQDFEYDEGAGTLDESNGRTGVTPEYPDGTYYYVLTDAFPFIPRSFQGTPDRSFERTGPPPGRGRPPFGRRPPPPGQGPPPGGTPPRF